MIMLNKVRKSACAFRPYLLLILLLTSLATDALAQAGYLHAMSGTVSARKANGESVRLKVGDTFEAGTTFNTGEPGDAVFKFADGQVLALGPNSTARVDQYQFDPRNVKASSSAIALLDGTMRFVAGVIATANREAARIIAGASTINILGTGGVDLTLVVNAKAGGEVGAAAVSVGEIAMGTPTGAISRIATGQVSRWQPGQIPAPPVPLAAAPAVVQAQVAAIRAIALPTNAPVVVASAARAAAAAAAADQAQAAAAANPGNAQLQAAAQAAAEQANSAAQAATAASNVFISTIMNSLPATAAGSAPAAAEVWLPITAITSMVTPGIRGCLGSPC